MKAFALLDKKKQRHCTVLQYYSIRVRLDILYSIRVRLDILDI